MPAKFNREIGEIEVYEICSYEKTLLPLINIVKQNLSERISHGDLGNNIKQEVDNFLAWDPKTNKDHEKAPFYSELVEAAVSHFQKAGAKAFDFCNELQVFILDFIRKEFSLVLEDTDANFIFC